MEMRRQTLTDLPGDAPLVVDTALNFLNARAAHREWRFHAVNS
jgi:hypothetical protein